MTMSQLLSINMSRLFNHNVSTLVNDNVPALINDNVPALINDNVPILVNDYDPTLVILILIGLSPPLGTCLSSHRTCFSSVPGQVIFSHVSSTTRTLHPWRRRSLDFHHLLFLSCRASISVLPEICFRVFFPTHTFHSITRACHRSTTYFPMILQLRRFFAFTSTFFTPKFLLHP